MVEVFLYWMDVWVIFKVLIDVFWNIIDVFVVKEDKIFNDYFIFVEEYRNKGEKDKVWENV